MEHMKKHLYWDIYGVKTFPYRGKRKYFPCIYQDYDGTVMVRNDVFGLTIAQFEREFKGCLERRKENEPQIQNVRFPDKTSREYIEYLKQGDDTVQGNITMKDFFDKDHDFRSLVNMAGTEYDIRIKQRMFYLMNKINNMRHPRYFNISSGSLAEGIDLPGSDIDKMTVASHMDVIIYPEQLNLSTNKTTLLMENDDNHPGFCKLKLVVDRNTQNDAKLFIETNDGVYLSTEKLLRLLLNVPSFKSFSLHGPCLSDPWLFMDFLFCLRLTWWPKDAYNWYNRHRKGQWPSCSVIDQIVGEGCLLVPIAPRNSENKFLWRISFSMAEKRLVHSMNYTQLLCYVLLKLTLQRIINRNKDAKDLLCSYFLKTTVFWLSEEISINTFKISNLSYCYFLCIDKLISFVRCCYCPNYFIPHHNMFLGKIDEQNNKHLLCCLSELGNTEFSFIIDRIFDNTRMHEKDFEIGRNVEESVKLEILFYRNLGDFICEGVEHAFNTLHYIKSVMELEPSEFLQGVFRYFHAIINQLIVQMMVLPYDRRKRYTAIRCCHKHLIDGTKSDAVTGWLLYASFLYKLGQYKESLQITDNVLARCTPDMLLLFNPNYTTEKINIYQNKTDSRWSLNQKMKHATFGSVCYLKNSTLTPQEMQLEVERDYFFAPPLYCHNVCRF